jgi:hypothetical protein
MDYLYKPAFYAHIFSSIAMVAAVVLLLINYKKLMKLDGIEIVKVLSVLAIAIAAHGQGHVTLEYGFDPVSQLLNIKV